MSSVWMCHLACSGKAFWHSRLDPVTLKQADNWQIAWCVANMSMYDVFFSWLAVCTPTQSRAPLAEKAPLVHNAALSHSRIGC